MTISNVKNIETKMAGKLSERLNHAAYRNLWDEMKRDHQGTLLT